METKINTQNAIIAEFMGLRPKCEMDGVYSYSDMPFYSIKENDIDKVIQGIAKYSKYNSNWDWLMGVIEKIKIVQPLANITISTNETSISVFDIEGKNHFTTCVKNNYEEATMLSITYKAIIHFINWHNEQKK
jgi:hypothetical protein